MHATHQLGYILFGIVMEVRRAALASWTRPGFHDAYEKLLSSSNARLSPSLKYASGSSVEARTTAPPGETHIRKELAESKTAEYKSNGKRACPEDCSFSKGTLLTASKKSLSTSEELRARLRPR